MLPFSFAYFIHNQDKSPRFAIPMNGFLKHQLKILGSFGIIQLMQLALPLLVLPWLARQLGPDAFGLLMYMLLIPPIVAQIMDWGLALGGARKASRRRKDPDSYSQLIGSVLSAKIMLGCGCALAGCALFPILPYASEYPWAYFFAIAAGMARGINPAWFFQGAGWGMPKMAALDAGASFFILISSLLFIHSAGQWIFYLVFLAAIKLLVYGWALFGICKKYKPVISFNDGFSIMKETYALFGYSVAQIICYNGTQLVIGFFLCAEDMGILGATNKMLRAFAALILPFTQTIFPEISRLANSTGNRGAFLARRSLLITAVVSIVAVVPVWVLAPWLIQIALGAQFRDAAPVFRIMLFAAPFMICNNVLAIQIMAANNKEKLLFFITTAVAFLSLPAAIPISFLGIDGAASLPILMESALAILYLGAILLFFPHVLLSAKRR